MIDGPGRERGVRNGSGQSGGCLTWKPAFRGCPVVPVTATASRRCWLCPTPPLRPCPRAHLPPASQPPASGLCSHGPNKPPPRGHKESLCFKFRLARLSYSSFGTRQHPALLKQAPRASLARSPQIRVLRGPQPPPPGCLTPSHSTEPNLTHGLPSTSAFLPGASIFN